MQVKGKLNEGVKLGLSEKYLEVEEIIKYLGLIYRPEA
jgi:hypothetical protein